MSTRKRGVRWWVDISYNGLRYRVPSPDNSLAGSKAYEAVLRQKLAKGESLAPEPINQIYTFKEFSAKWFEIYVKNNNKPSEIIRKDSILKVHLLPYFGKYQLTDIKSFGIEEFKTLKINKGYNPKSINNYLGVLAKCLKTAMEWEIINSVPRIKPLKVQPQKFDYLTEAEAEQLLNTATGVYHSLIKIALYTGLRFSELVALSWDDVNLKDKVLTVTHSFSGGVLGSTKSNKIRYIPLIDELCELFRTLPVEYQRFIFVNQNSSHYLAEACRRNLHWICDKAKLRHVGWHTLRHTFASRLAGNNVSVMAIKDLLGHSEIRTTMRYAHLGPMVLRDAVLTLDKNSRHNPVTTSNFRENLEVNFLAQKINFTPINTKETSF